MSKLNKINKSTKILTIDWLTLNVYDCFQTIPFDERNEFRTANLLIKRANFRTRHFNNVAYVFNYGRKIATITYEANNKLIFRDTAQIKCENDIFYDGTLQQWYELLTNELMLSDIRVSRIDIACDGVNFHNHLNAFLDDSKTSPFVAYGNNCKITPYLNDTTRAYSGNFDTFYFGSRGGKNGTKKTERFGRYYNKSVELENNTKDKTYIKDYFKNNNLGDTVYRFEIELSSTYISKIKDFQIDWLFSHYRITQIFRLALKGFFRFHKGDNTNVSRCTEIDLFHGLIESTPLELIKREVKSSLRTVQTGIKRTIKDLYIGKLNDSDFLQTSKVIETVNYIINKNDLFEWWQDTKLFLFQDIEELATHQNLFVNPHMVHMSINNLNLPSCGIYESDKWIRTVYGWTTQRVEQNQIKL